MLFADSASGMRLHAVQEAAEVAPTDEEVATAKSETLNSFVFNFASTNAQMQRVAAYALLGIPEVTWDLIPLLAPWLLLSKTTRASGCMSYSRLHIQSEPHACPDTPDVSHLEIASLEVCANYSQGDCQGVHLRLRVLRCLATSPLSGQTPCSAGLSVYLQERHRRSNSRRRAGSSEETSAPFPAGSRHGSGCQVCEATAGSKRQGSGTTKARLNASMNFTSEASYFSGRAMHLGLHLQKLAA